MRPGDGTRCAATSTARASLKASRAHEFYLPRLRRMSGVPRSHLAAFYAVRWRGLWKEEMTNQDSPQTKGSQAESGPMARNTLFNPIQINRNTSGKGGCSQKPQGRNKNCGRFTLLGTSPDGTQRYIRVDCGCWGCAYCGPRKAWMYRQAIRYLAEAYQLRRFLTLTVDPKLIDGADPVKYINRAFAKWRIYLQREFGVSVTYIRVLEFQKNGNPHFHILIDRFIPQAWIQRTWQAVGGGKYVNIKLVAVHRISRYLSKYLTKELLLSAPKRSRRVTVSRGLRLITKQKSLEQWLLVRISIWILLDRLAATVFNVELDKEGILKSFNVSGCPAEPKTCTG